MIFFMTEILLWIYVSRSPHYAWNVFLRKGAS
jgi:hypothetical protein